MRKIAILFVSTLLLPSCLKEDRANCPEQIRVYFTFATPDSNPADVSQIDLYVFSDKGYYLGEYRDDHIIDFNPSYYIDCSDLLPGKYRFIAFGGKEIDRYATSPSLFIKGETSFEEALWMLKHGGDVISTKLSHIFHGDLLATVTYAKTHHFYVPLAQISNTINIRTEGLTPDLDSYRFDISDNNCCYAFDCSFALHPSHSANQHFTYTTSCVKSETYQLNATLNVLRLAAHRHTPQLQLYNETAGKVLYPVGTQSSNLIELILNAYPQNDFDATHTYDILFTFEGDASTGLSVTVTINGWQVHDQKNELTDE